MKIFLLITLVVIFSNGYCQFLIDDNDEIGYMRHLLTEIVKDEMITRGKMIVSKKVMDAELLNEIKIVNYHFFFQKY
jgi:hypothetical protein